MKAVNQLFNPNRSLHKAGNDLSSKNPNANILAEGLRDTFHQTKNKDTIISISKRIHLFDSPTAAALASDILSSPSVPDKAKVKLIWNIGQKGLLSP